MVLSAETPVRLKKYALTFHADLTRRVLSRIIYCLNCSLQTVKPPIINIYNITTIKCVNFANCAFLCQRKALHLTGYRQLLLLLCEDSKT